MPLVTQAFRTKDLGNAPQRIDELNTYLKSVFSLHELVDTLPVRKVRG